MEAGRDLQVVDPAEVPGTDLFHEFRPSAPCCRLIELLHGESSKVVLFTQAQPKSGSRRGQWVEHGGISVNRLGELFQDADFLRQIEQDSYFTPLAYHEFDGRSKQARQYVRASPLLKYTSRKGSNVAAFPCLWVDLDCYRTDYSIGQTVGAVIDLSRAGKLPEPSLYVNSGRGVWCLWVLRDSNGYAPANTPENFSAWLGCMNRLAELMKDLGNDPKAQLLSQVARIPGTINTRANDGHGARVEWRARLDGFGFMQRYTLQEIATRLDVRHHDRHESWLLARQGKQHEDAARVLVRPVDPQKSANGRLGLRAVYVRRVDQIRRLAEIRARSGRPGVPIGKRRQSAWLYAICLNRSGLAEAAVDQRIEAERNLAGEQAASELSRHRLREEFVKQQTRQFVEAAFQKGTGDHAFDLEREVFSHGWNVPQHRFSDLYVAKLFEPTEEESHLCGMPTVRQANDRKAAQTRRPTRTQKARLKAQAILAVLESNPKAKPSLVAQVCTDVHGVKISERTARNYLRNLRTTGELSSRPMVLPCLPTDPTAN